MTAPAVELHFDPAQLAPGVYMGRYPDVVESALHRAREQVVKHVLMEIPTLGVHFTGAQLIGLMDEAWVFVMPSFVANVGPLTGAAYYRAYQQAAAGEIPRAYLDKLASEHAARLGGYFKETSAEALEKGFNTYVNRRMPARAAAERVMQAYGLTERQMSGFTSSAASMETKVESGVVRSLQSKARSYVEKSLRSRIKLIADQEDHNLTQEAQQTVWLYLAEHDKITEHAEKIWITAKDEKVCPSCGPLHGKKIPVAEKFQTKLGEFWVPGLHPNCRCVVRLMDHPFMRALEGELSKAADWEEKEHPRDEVGRFSAKARTRYKDPTDNEQAFTAAQRFLDTAKEEPEAVRMSTTEAVRMSPGPVKITGPVRMTNEPVRMKPQLDPAIRSSIKTQSPVKITNRLEQDPVKTRQAYESAIRTELVRPEKLRRRAPQIYYRDTVNVAGEVGHRLFFVPEVDMSMMDANGRAMLNHNMTFSDHDAYLAGQVESRFNEQINDMIDETVSPYGNDGMLYLNEIEGPLHAKLDDSTWESVIRSIAYTDSSDPDWSSTEYYEIDLYDNENKYVKTSLINSNQIGEEMGIHSSDFDVPVLALVEGYNSEPYGTTHSLAGATRHGAEDWVTSGVYQTEPDEHSVIMGPNRIGARMRIYTLIPEIDTVPMGVDPEELDDGWNE